MYFTLNHNTLYAILWGFNRVRVQENVLERSIMLQTVLSDGIVAVRKHYVFRIHELRNFSTLLWWSRSIILLLVITFILKNMK